MEPICVAILTGGPSAERGISLKSAEYIKRFLPADRFSCYTIDMQDDGWYCLEEEGEIDLNDFSLHFNKQSIHFDFVFIIIHGTPAEDGKIQGYFEILNIPYSCSDTLTSALTFDKDKCKRFLSTYDIPMADATLVRAGDAMTVDPTAFTYPVFVKPNKNGSSYGVAKVLEAGDLQAALDNAFHYDDEVLVERFIDGTEISCGVLQIGNKIHALPLTEIVPHGDFFDYSAKYEGASEEITPARIADTLTKECQTLSSNIYSLLNCKGMVRIDYILLDNTFYLLEVNTIPGLSPTSIVPQMARAYGWTDGEMLENIVLARMHESTSRSIRESG